MTEQQFRQPLYREFESLGLFVYLLIITDLSTYSNERYERLLLGAWLSHCFLMLWTSNSNFQLGHPDMEGGTCHKTLPSSQLHTWQRSHLSAGVPRPDTWALWVATGTEDSERMDSWFLNYFILNWHKIYIIILSGCHPRAFPVSNVTIIKRKSWLFSENIAFITVLVQNQHQPD